MKLTHIAATVAVALLSSNAALAAEGESAVTSAVKSVVKTVAEADAQSKHTAKAKQEPVQKQAEDEGYVAVPAKYLRTNADPAAKQQAVEQMKKNVKAEDKAAEESRRKPDTVPVGQVQINTNHCDQAGRERLHPDFA